MFLCTDYRCPVIYLHRQSPSSPRPMRIRPNAITRRYSLPSRKAGFKPRLTSDTWHSRALIPALGTDQFFELW